MAIVALVGRLETVIMLAMYVTVTLRRTPRPGHARGIGHDPTTVIHTPPALAADLSAPMKGPTCTSSTSNIGLETKDELRVDQRRGLVEAPPVGASARATLRYVLRSLPTTG